jgi:hypothetical protein
MDSKVVREAGGKVLALMVKGVAIVYVNCCHATSPVVLGDAGVVLMEKVQKKKLDVQESAV